MGLRSLRALSLAFLLAFITVTVGTGIAIHHATHLAIVSLVDQRIETESHNVSGPRLPITRRRVLERINSFIGDRNTADIGVDLSDRANNHLGGNYRFEHRPPPGFSTLGPDVGIKGLTHGRAYVRDIGNDMVLTVFAETEPVDNYNAARLRIYIAGFGAIIVLVVGALILFVRAVGRRIAAQNATAEAIIDGDMLSRVPVSGSRSELDEQARIFNRMLDRIGELMTGLAHVSSDIAHDLRTPLARLRSQLVTIRRGVEDSRLREEVDAAIEQNDRILAMFAAILRIVEVEGGDRRAGFRPIDLGVLARRTAEMMAPVAEESGHRVAVGRCDVAPITGDEQLLSQAIINLIQNAEQHTPPGSTVTVSVVVGAAAVELVVEDDGPGISPDQHERALRRFGRIDKARARPGHGLGLPLVEAIARLHQGTLSLADAKPGLRVAIVLPSAHEKGAAR